MKDCVSLEVAQKLQKAGWKGETEYYYNKYFSRPEEDTREVPYYLLENEKAVSFIPAPTATQLAEELPWWLEKYQLSIYKLENQWQVGYGREEDLSFEYTEAEKTLPDALGLMRVYLLENNLFNAS